MPLQNFKLFYDVNNEIDYKTTLTNWGRALNYMFSKKLDNSNILSTNLSVTIVADQIKDSNIDWGTGSDQVNAASIPIVDASSYFSGTTIESALAEIGNNFSQVSHTTEGGVAIYLTNKTGSDSIKGSVVSASTDNSSFILQSDQLSAIGIVYDDGVSDGSQAMVVVSGTARVLLENNTAAIAGEWVGASTDPGRAIVGNIPPLITDHFMELGHCLENKSASTDEQTVKIAIHFN